jgi:hypothetical protein
MAITTSTSETISRSDLLIRQIDLIVKATTGSTTFFDVIKRCIKEKWVQTITINGNNKEGHTQQQIIINIDWDRHEYCLQNVGEVTQIDFSSDEKNWVSSIIGNIIDGFNEITNSFGLEANWLITYTPEANLRREELNKILGLVPAEPEIWADGKVEYMLDKYRPKKLDEMIMSWTVITK